MTPTGEKKKAAEEEKIMEKSGKEEKPREKKREIMMMKGQRGRERIKKERKKDGQNRKWEKKTKTKEQLEKGMQA